MRARVFPFGSRGLATLYTNRVWLGIGYRYGKSADQGERVYMHVSRPWVGNLFVISRPNYFCGLIKSFNNYVILFDVRH